MSAKPLILRVFGIDAHCCVAHDCFGTCGGNYGIVALVVLVQNLALFACRYDGIHVGIGYIVLQIIQFALLVAIDDLFGREHGLCLRVPVDHTEPTIDEAFVVEVAEDFHDAFAALFVHCEGRAVPVATCSKLAKLLQDDASVFFCPGPSVLQELFASEVTLLDALFSKTVHHLCLRSNRGVVCAWHPTSVLAIESCLTNQDVLNRIVEHVSHVEHTRHVWWRNDDGVGLTTVWFARKELMLCPVLVPFSLDFCGAVFCC